MLTAWLVLFLAALLAGRLTLSDRLSLSLWQALLALSVLSRAAAAATNQLSTGWARFVDTLCQTASERAAEKR